MYHIADAARQVYAVEQIDGLGTVGQGDGEALPFPETQGFQAAAAAPDLPDHLPVSDGAAHEVKGDLVRIPLRDGLYRFKHGALGILQMHGHSVHVILPGRLNVYFHYP